MHVRQRFAFLLLAILPLIGLAEEGLLLARQGHPEARIILPRVFGKGTLLAADELAEYVEKMTGAKLPIDTYGTTSERRRDPLTHILLVPKVDPARQASADGSEDAFTITATADSLTIAGNSDTAVLYGVYQLLDEQGVRWFFPGPMGEHVPRQPDLVVPLGSKTYHPSFRTREIDLSGTAHSHFDASDHDRLIPEYAMWILRNRCQFSRGIHRDYRPDVNHKREQTAHWLPTILRHADIEKEPERFPLVTTNGKAERLERGGQICFTDPRNVETTVRLILDWFEENPGNLTATTSPGDHGGFCECERCITANGGILPSHDPNLVVWTFMNQVIRGIRANMPSKRIAFYASYGGLTKPPEGFEIEDGILAITANVGANNARIDNPDDPFASRYLADVKRIKAGGAELGAREYTMFSGTPQPLVLLEQISIYRDLGYVYYHCESMGRDELRYPIQWVQAQLLWDADRDPDALLEEACKMLYGPAGPDVLALLKRIDARERQLPRLVFGSTGVMQWIMSLELCREGDRTLSAAKQKVSGIHARRLQRIIDSFHMFTAQADFVRAAYLAMDERTEKARRVALKKHDAFEKLWKERDLHELCSANILGKCRMLRGHVEKLDFEAEPQPRKGFEDPSPDAKLEALYSLLDLPETVPALHYLPDVWKFKPDIERRAVQQKWFEVGFDDSDWRDLSVHNFYERQGYDWYDGAFCYRTRFQAPDFPAGKTIMLRIGSLDDEGAIYINGKLAYRRWHLAPGDWKRSFVFDVTGFIRPGEENVIAILGNDEYGMGGLWNPSALYITEE